MSAILISEREFLIVMLSNRRPISAFLSCERDSYTASCVGNCRFCMRISHTAQIQLLTARHGACSPALC